MAGPDSKRMYLSIVAQNMDKIKAEKPYWNKNFVPITASGAGTKYTMLQAAMMLDKMKVVKYLAGHPAVDFSVKSTDNKSTLMIAAISQMPVSVLEKILERYDLRTINELDPAGNTALDLCEPDTEEYDFLQSVGCKTKADREATLHEFLVSAGNHVVHQRVRKKGEGERRPAEQAEAKSGAGSTPQKTPRSTASGRETPTEPERRGAEQQDGNQRGTDANSPVKPDDADCAVDEMDEDPWQLVDTPEDLLHLLQDYLETWGSEGDDGELCQEWVEYVTKKLKKGNGDRAVQKWNALMTSMYGEENLRHYSANKHETAKQTEEAGAPASEDKREAEPLEESVAPLPAQDTEKRPDADMGRTGDVPRPEVLKNFFDPTAPPIEMKTPRKPPPPDGGPRVVGLGLDKEEARKQVAELLGSPRPSLRERRASAKK
ncbi:hypothetical protein BESB_021350 [Besnoitia besnoiti]|uniref:Ankyrin repeat-containing protein n=1 Tax=Besnoitia besnoiti TaxID=94643 RepID=A0A2A9M4P9_BESBE|nr:hypothetical protein BESB_021350 [Besnoitia besnoiti]PFH32194.1 hypothetical protein BESB_021350 [Besnoitia besnoiti]